MESWVFVTKAEMWKFPEPSFSHTNIFFRNKYTGDIVRIMSDERERHIVPEQLDVKAGTAIPLDFIRPRLPEGLTIYHSRMSQLDCYIKRPDLRSFSEDDSLSQLVLQEARICEVLMRHPHPNIVQYLGCIVEDNRIDGLVFRKYEQTLSDYLESGGSFDRLKCFQQIEAAVHHMHSLSLVHGDLRSSNVMLDTNNNAVLIDFDSCCKEGHPLGRKPGRIAELKPQTQHAAIENDIACLEMLGEELGAPAWI